MPLGAMQGQWNADLGESGHDRAAINGRFPANPGIEYRMLDQALKLRSIQARVSRGQIEPGHQNSWWSLMFLSGYVEPDCLKGITVSFRT